VNLLSLIKRLLADRSGQLSYYTLVDRIGVLARSARDLKTFLAAAADEFGSALNLTRSVILLKTETGLKHGGEYSTPELNSTTKERLRLLDSEIARELALEHSPVEMKIAEATPTLKAAFDRALDETGNQPAVDSIMFAPFTDESQAIGAILFYMRKHHRLSSGDKEALQSIASCLSLALHHIQSQESAKNAASREVLTHQLLTAIRCAGSVDETLKSAVDGLGTTLGVTRVVIFKHRDGELGKASGQGLSNLLTARAEYRSSVLVPSLLQTGLDVEGSPLLSRLLSGEMIVIPDTNDGDPIVRALCVRFGVRALVLAPIAYKGHTVAALALEQFDRPREFSDEEMRLLRLVTEQTAVALYQAELYREAQESARREALIRKINSAIHSSLDPDAVLQAIVNELGAALSVCRCRLALLPNPMPEQVPLTHEYVAECCNHRQADLQTIQLSNNAFFQMVIAASGPVAVDDPANDLRMAPFNDRYRVAEVKSLLAAAIRNGGRPIGIFSLHHCEEYHTWTQWEIDIARSVVEQAAVAIRQSELYREVRESATRAALVNQIVASIRSSLDLKQTLGVAAEEVGRALGASRTNFRQLVGDKVVVVAEHLIHPDLSIKHVAADVGDFIMNYLVEKRRTLVVDDVSEFASAHPSFTATVRGWQVEPRSLSQIICPIFVNDLFWGALSISQTDRYRKWTASEIALVEEVTAQVEVAVSHSRLFEEAKQAAEREALISQIVHGINQSNQLSEIFPIVARELGDYLAADRIIITKLDEEAGLWINEFEYSDHTVSSHGQTYPVEALEKFSEMVESEMIRSDDVETDLRMLPFLDQLLRPVGTRAFLSVRVNYQGAVKLVITAIMTSGPRVWANEELEVIRAAADQVLTALQRAELFEQVSHGKYEWEATFDALTDGILIFDQKGQLCRVNEAGAAFENAHVRDLIGRQCCTLLQGIEGETCRVANVIKTGRPVTFELVPERLKRPVLVTITPLKNGSWSRSGDKDNPHGAVCIVRDLSELRAAEAVAREQRGFLVKLIEHANDSISAFSPTGRLIWFNERLVKLSGYSREELTASDYRLFLAGDDKKTAVERFTGALAGEAQTFELNASKRNGESRLLLITFTPIYDEGGVTSVLSIARDITEERLASERAAQADKLRALGQLASGVAHNFNNILAAILGHAQLIKRDCNEEGTIQRVDIIEKAALDGAQTVKRIQGFGLQQTEEARDFVDINQLVQDSTGLTRARWSDEAQARGLRYEVELDLQLTRVVRGAASELREVFVNMILNALDAMPAGGKLRIATAAKGASAQISFADSGIGMTREVSDHIFEPFFTTKGVKGMGLGLAVSYSIVERHGGRIEAISSPGRGTTFTITLPTDEAALKEAKCSEISKAKAANVLVIDDDERVREALVGMLSLAGHRTDHAANGREAMAKMEQEKFDLVFTDLSMPEIDGWAVASEIRRRWPDVKIVLITGYTLPTETVKRHSEFVNEIISKPIRFDDISATLSQVLS
jgi:PAS domain S-box-containing protein